MIDLHCHSNCSDGSDPPQVLTALADQAGLKAVALTDHDTLVGLDVFMDQQRRVSALLVPGIELSCEFLRQEIHVLGLFINHRDPLFQKRVDTLLLRRQRRNAQIFQKLSDLNMNLSPEKFFYGEEPELITRAHIAEMLTEAGYADTKAEAFKKYLGEEGLAYTPFEHLSAEEAFTWIREARGIPVIAHPARYGSFARGWFTWDRAMADLRDKGAMGIEVYYADHTDSETEYFLKLCCALGMAPAGGSDYHGRIKPGCKLGRGWGRLYVPDSVLEKLLEKLPGR